MKKRRKVNLLVILSVFICLVFVTLNSVKFKFLLEVISPMSVFIDIFWVYDLGIWISIWLVVFFKKWILVFFLLEISTVVSSWSSFI